MSNTPENRADQKRAHGGRHGSRNRRIDGYRSRPAGPACRLNSLRANYEKNLIVSRAVKMSPEVASVNVDLWALSSRLVICLTASQAVGSSDISCPIVRSNRRPRRRRRSASCVRGRSNAPRDRAAHSSSTTASSRRRAAGSSVTFSTNKSLPSGPASTGPASTRALGIAPRARPPRSTRSITGPACPIWLALHATRSPCRSRVRA